MTKRSPAHPPAADLRRHRYAPLLEELIQTGADFHRRGWSLGTSSNFSVVVERDPLVVLLTGSGHDKGRLRSQHFVLVDDHGTSLHPDFPKPSAETLLHVVLARSAEAGAVLHTHSVAATVLSTGQLPTGALELEGYEMLKGLSGIATHDTRVSLPIFPNTQDMIALSGEVEDRLLDKETPLRHGFLLSGHGLYTWGADLAEARRQVEVLEFLFEVSLHQRLLFPNHSKV